MTAPLYVTYQPSAKDGDWDLRLEGAQLSRAGGWSIDLDRVTDAVFSNSVSHGERKLRLTLMVGEDRYALPYQGSDGGFRSDDSARAHLELVIAVLNRLAQINSGLAVTLAVTRGGRGLFWVGLGALAAGLVLTGAMLRADISPEQLVTGGIPAAGLVLVGAVLTIARAPWKRPSTVPPEVLAETLKGVLS